MMHPEVRAVRPQLFGGDGELDGLEQRVRRGADLRAVGVRPVSERQEPDLLQRSISLTPASYAAFANAPCGSSATPRTWSTELTM